MKTYRLSGGGEIPAIGLGTWKAEPGEVGEAVREALAVGYRHIDCASIYGNEPEIGEALVGALDAGTVARDALWITSKLWNDCHEPSRVRPALERTLGDLRLDFVDLYLMHWPVALRPGVFVPEKAEDLVSLDEMPLADTWRALEGCVDAGLCRSIGVSNFSARKLARLLDGARIRPAVNQIETHPFLQQAALVDFCRSEGVLVTAYSPLGSPDRPEVLKRSDEPSLLGNPVVMEVAQRHGTTPAQVLIAWSLHRDTAVLPKSVRPERLRENLAAQEVRLEADDMARLGKLDRSFRYVHGAFWVVEGGPYTLGNLWDV